MFDHALAKAVVTLNVSSKLLSIEYFDDQRKQLGKKPKSFDFALLSFENGQCFELSWETMQLLDKHKFKMKKG